MEYETVFISLAVVLVCVLAFFGSNGLVTSYNEEYGSTVGQNSQFASSIQRIQGNLSNSFGNTGQTMGGAVDGQEGAGSADAQSNLITRSLSIIITLKELLGLTEDTLKEADSAIGGSATGNSDYVNIAVSLFVIIFAIVFGYLLLVGARKL